MAVTRGRIGEVSLDANAIGRVIDATLTIESGEITVTTHDSGQWEEFLQGRKSGTIEVTTRYDESDTAQQAAIAASFAETTVVLVWVSQGLATSGAERFTATAFVSATPLESPNDEDNKLGLTFRITGAVTRDTVP